MFKKIVSIVLVASLATLVFAQDQGMGGGMGMRAAPKFEDLDADGDGSITKEEMGKFIREDMLDQRFGRVDADGDGVISREEFDNRPQGGGMGGQPSE